jgi:hypothetical protein
LSNLIKSATKTYWTHTLYCGCFFLAVQDEFVGGIHDRDGPIWELLGEKAAENIMESEWYYFIINYSLLT